MKASQHIHIEGHVSADFEAMRNVFADNLSRHYEPGGVSCVHHCGEKVVNY